MGGRVYRAAMVTPPPEPKGRVYRSAIAGTAPALLPRGRVYRSAMVGTVPVELKGRVYRSALVGTASVVLAPFAPITVEPMTPVKLTALLTDGTTAEEYAWRQISGPPVEFTGTWHTREFAAPSTFEGGTVVIGVRASVGDTLSAERTATITVLPQVVWMRTHTNQAWRGCRISL